MKKRKKKLKQKHKKHTKKRIKKRNKLLKIIRDPMFKMRVVSDKTKYNRKTDKIITEDL